MIDGITVLNTIDKAFSFEFVIGILFGIGLLIAGFMTIRMALKEKTKDYISGAIMIGAGILMIFASYLITFSPEPSYEVLIDNSVSFMDFYEKYHIVGQRGDIFTIVMK